MRMNSIEERRLGTGTALLDNYTQDGPLAMSLTWPRLSA
jgi:hypothetical protein